MQTEPFFRSRFILSFLRAGVSVFFFAVALNASSFSSIPFQKIYSPAVSAEKDWLNEGNGGIVSLEQFEGVATLEGKNPDQGWAAVYRNVSVDLDRHPIIQVRVLSVSHQWFLILSGPQFPKGFVCLIEGSETGTFRFNIREKMNLSGRQNFMVKIGVSQPGMQRLSGGKVAFDQIAFVSPDPATLSPEQAHEEKVQQKRTEESGQTEKERLRIKKEGGVFLLDPDGGDADAWQEWIGSGPHEVRFSYTGAIALVRGKMRTQNWGAAHRSVTVNLKQYPILEIDVPSVSRSWYLIVNNPKLKDGFTRLIETNQPGRYEFNIAKISGLSGIETFDVQVGVLNPESNSHLGEWVSFDLLRFKKQ